MLYNWVFFHLVIFTIISSNSKLDCDEEQDLVSAGISLHKDDFSSALDQLQAAHSDAIGAPKVRNV